MRKLLIILSIMMVCGVSQAQFVFTPAFNFESNSSDASTPTVTPNVQTDSKSTALTTDLRAGYLLPSGLYIGAMYSLMKGTANNGAAESELSGYSVGPSIGYYNSSGFNAMLTYHLVGESGVSSGGNEVTYTGATGLQFDMGWNFPITSTFGLGPQVSYISTGYSKVESTGNPTQDTDYKNSSIDWSLAMWFMF